MAKSGSKEWYKEKYDAAKAEIAALKAELEAVEPNSVPDGVVVLDTSLMSCRNKQAIDKFLAKSQRYAKKEPGQIAASLLAQVADSARRSSVAAIIKTAKALPGSGLR